jgi:O-antigen ligase
MFTRFMGANNKNTQWLWVICILLFSLAGGIIIGFFGRNLFFVWMAGLIGLILLWLSATKERFALYLLVASIPLGEFLKVGFIPSTLLVIPGGLAVFSLLISILLRRQSLRIHTPIFIPAFLLGLWVTISSIYNGGTLADVRPYWLVIIFVFLLPALLRSQRDLVNLCWVLVLSLGLAGTYVFITRISDYLGAAGLLNATNLHNMNLEIGDKNNIGMMLSLALPVAFYLTDYYHSQPRKCIWLYVCGIAALLGALATLSIGTFVGLCIFIILIIWMQDKSTKRVRYILLGIGIVILAVISPLAERLQSATSVNLDNVSWGTYRMTIWESSFRVFSEHPFWGVGANQDRVGQAVIAYTDPIFQTQLFQHNRFGIVPHNILLSIAVEAGTPGLIFYLAMILTSFYVTWDSIRKLRYKSDTFFLYIFGKVLFISLAILLIQAMALSAHLNKYIWLIFGCVGAYWFIVRDFLELSPERLNQ